MSNIIENILKKLEEKKLTRKEFALRLINYDPKVGIKSEPPSERTIYLYLQGKRELKADLIPYIADVLNIKEQELFEDSTYYNTKTTLKSKEKLSSKEELMELLADVPENIIKSFIKIAKEFKSKK